MKKYVGQIWFAFFLIAPGCVYIFQNNSSMTSGQWVKICIYFTILAALLTSPIWARNIKKSTINEKDPTHGK